MRVRYTGQRPEGASVQGVDALKVEREYLVLEISTLVDRASYFRIEVVKGEPSALYDVRLFGIESSLIPSNWIVSLDGGGLLTIGPGSWRANNFWEAFLDRQEWAVELYESELRRIAEARHPGR